MELKVSKSNINISKYKDIAIPVGFIIIALAILLLVGFKSFGSLAPLKESIAASQARLTGLEERRRNLEIISGMSGILDENIALVVSAVPEKDEVSGLLSQIQQIAGEAGVTLKSLQYTGSSKGYKSEKAPINSREENGLFVQVSVDGSYSQLVKFLELLENARRIVNFESLRLSAVSKEDLTRLNGSLSATGYYLEQKAAREVSGNEKIIDFRSGDLNKILEELRSYKRYETKSLLVEPDVEEPIL